MKEITKIAEEFKSIGREFVKNLKEAEEQIKNGECYTQEEIEKEFGLKKK